MLYICFIQNKFIFIPCILIKSFTNLKVIRGRHKLPMHPSAVAPMLPSLGTSIHSSAGMLIHASVTGHIPTTMDEERGMCLPMKD